MSSIDFTVNGRPVRATGVSPTTTLLAYLRGELGLVGTKEGCAEGDCGACTVAILDPEAGRHRAINACLILLPMVQGKEVITVEGLQTDGQPHPVQARLVEALGSQCGYCTPGVVMSMFEACYRSDVDEGWQLDDQMCGNLCRCTGYRPIREATEQIVGLRPDDRFRRAAEAANTAGAQPMDLAYAHGEQQFFTPGALEDLWDLIDAHPSARFVCGGTDLSLEVTKRFEAPPLLISLEGIDALRGIERRDDRWVIGATTDLATLEAATRHGLPAIERMLRFFGARQIKNRATLGGNLCNASPIGDMAPILIALGAQAILQSRSGTRSIPLEDFFISYRKTALAKGEILAAVDVPLPTEDTRCCAFKVSKRRELDISAVSAGLYVKLDAAGVVTEARFAYGGMAATPKRASKAEAAATGSTWSEATADAAAKQVADDFAPIGDHRGSAWYRATVAANLLRGFYDETATESSPRLPDRPTGTLTLRAQP